MKFEILSLERQCCR